MPVPLSELERDLPTPGEGWAAHLAARGVEIVLDDLGRASISRDAARQLFVERRESEAKAREHAAVVERRAIEQDRAWRASLGVGVPASALPAGRTYAAAALSAELDGQAYRPRATVVEDLLSNDGSLTFHSFAPPEDES
jgi:hypothetical protein